MTDAEQIVKTFMLALQAKEFDRAAGCLSDGLIFSGFTPRPLAKDEFMTLVKELAEGFPNLTYTVRNLEEVKDTSEGKKVTGTVQITGRQDNSFTLQSLGIGPIPQMAASVTLPEQTWDFRLRSDSIDTIRVNHVQGGGIDGLIQQLGISFPS